MKNQNPKGGTELQLEFLNKYVKKELLDQVQICTSVPGKIPTDPNKVNILWQKNSWDQPCLLYTSPSPRDGLLSRMPSSA